MLTVRVTEQCSVETHQHRTDQLTPGVLADHLATMIQEELLAPEQYESINKLAR